jgi:hypothetical protein
LVKKTFVVKAHFLTIVIIRVVLLFIFLPRLQAAKEKENSQQIENLSAQVNSIIIRR